MFFALTDYWMYKERKGRYSHENLVVQQLYPATEKNFLDYKTYPIGTMLFTCTFNSILSWAVMYCTNSTISHVAVFYGDGIIHDCTTSGIMRHSFANYLDGESYIGIISFQDRGNAEKMRAFMDKTLGDGYNWLCIVTTFFQILLGTHKDVPWRLWADSALLTMLLWAVAHWVAPVFDYVFGGMILGLVVAVAFNRLLKIMRPKLRSNPSFHRT